MGLFWPAPAREGMPALVNCAELILSSINYAGCDGTYTLNHSKPEGCDACQLQPLHWSKQTGPNDGRQLWWCGQDDDDPAGKYSCTPWTTPACGGSFGSGTDVKCVRCVPGYEGPQCATAKAGWADALTLLLLLGGVAYVVGGVAYGRRHGSSAAGLGAHPHRARWSALAGLCRDGVTFSRRVVRGGGFQPLGDADRGGSRAAGAGSPRGKEGRAKGKGKSKGKSAKRSSGGGGGGGDDGSSAPPPPDDDAHVEGGVSERLLREDREHSSGQHASQARVKVVALS